jgi:hypothetical protein
MKQSSSTPKMSWRSVYHEAIHVFRSFIISGLMLFMFFFTFSAFTQGFNNPASRPPPGPPPGQQSGGVSQAPYMCHVISIFTGVANSMLSETEHQPCGQDKGDNPASSNAMSLSDA